MNNTKYIAHHGIKGQKWYVRRYQNEDGSLTEEGKKRYYHYEGEVNRERLSKDLVKSLNLADQNRVHAIANDRSRLTETKREYVRSTISRYENDISKLLKLAADNNIQITSKPTTRIGWSDTQRKINTIAGYLGGIPLSLFMNSINGEYAEGTYYKLKK